MHMSRHINPVKPKAGAEPLEWVLRPSPEGESVQALFQDPQPMNEDAKTGRVLVPITDRRGIPGRLLRQATPKHKP